MGFNPVKCVLFDMDGLLLDTENLYSEGTQKVLSQFGDKVQLALK
jgi:beta-phosphoglucomutase-like phosphatase (HAD superfamily)